MAPLKYWKIKEYLEGVAVRPESAVRMPTVRELMAQFNVSLATVNRALSELENDGVIIRRQGSGIVAAGNARAVKRLDSNAENGGKTLFFAHNDYPDEATWRMVHAVFTHARNRKCNVIDFKIYQDTPTEAILEQIKTLPECGGALFLVGSDRMDRERIDALGNLRCQVSVVDSMYFYENLPKNFHTLSPDPASAAELTIAELTRNGHRRIGYIRNEPRSEYTDAFQKALLQTARRAGLEFGPEQIFSSTIRSWENSLDAAVQLTLTHLETIRSQKLTALIYKSSGGALVAVKALAEAGLRVPDDLSLIGEGDRSLYRHLLPGLTVEEMDYQSMACTAVDILLGLHRPKAQNLFFPHRLIIRDSVKNINGTLEEGAAL